jgi:hypothetical protein
MITGHDPHLCQTMREVRQVLDPKPGHLPFGIHLMIGKNYTVFLADTTSTSGPRRGSGAIAKETAAVARRLGHEPRVAFLSYSTFGNPPGRWLEPIREAVAILDAENPGFEYEGELAPDAALNPTVMKNYPFSRLSGPANVLIMPGLQSANISAKLLRELAGQRHDRADADRHGKAGPDRADDGDRARRADAGGAGGGGDTVFPAVLAAATRINSERCGTQNSSIHSVAGFSGTSGVSTSALFRACARSTARSNRSCATGFST